MEAQIVAALKKQETGIPAKEISREYGISEVTFYNWKSKYERMETSDVKRIKDLEEENSRLKCIFSELSMDNAILKDVTSKINWSIKAKKTIGILKKDYVISVKGSRAKPSLLPKIYIYK
jgi:putative transposase